MKSSEADGPIVYKYYFILVLRKNLWHIHWLHVEGGKTQAPPLARHRAHKHRGLGIEQRGDLHRDLLVASNSQVGVLHKDPGHKGL